MISEHNFFIFTLNLAKHRTQVTHSRGKFKIIINRNTAFI